jgi:formate dehydrogenase major subunit
MKITRREFLTLAGTTAAGLMLSSCAGQQVKPVKDKVKDMRPDWANAVTTICPYCGVGCGAIVVKNMSGNAVISVEGDPDHPVNEGSLCSKGSALYQLHFDVTTGEANPNRVTDPMYRAPGSSTWEVKSWDWTLDEIAKRIKNTRDKYFKETDDKDRTVNRLEAIANLGGAALDNEECYLLSKLTRALGIVYLEHQARI